MKKLSALIFYAAIVPAMALSPAAFAETAEDSDNTNLQGANKEDANEQHSSAAPAGALHANEVIGQSVQLRGSGDEVGEVQDLVIDQDGSIVGVVVTTGSFLGLGGREIRMDWDQIEPAMEGDESWLYTDMDEDDLRNAPEYQRE